MRYIKMCLFFLGVLLGMSLIGFFGLIGLIGVCGIFMYLREYCPEILVSSGMFIMGVLFVTVGWSIFCKFADKLKDS